MKPKQVRVYAPASISNVGPGFDMLGIAIEKPGDIVLAKRTSEPGLHFTLESPIELPKNKDNVAAFVAQKLISEFNPPFGIALHLQKNMPVGSGLGSSGASCAAAAFAVNCLLAKPLSKMDLLPFAIQGEKLASGSAHADNIAPSILGGISLVTSYSPLKVVQLPFKNNFYWVVAHPDLVILTKDAREILPKSIPISDAIAQTTHLAALLMGLQNGDANLIQLAIHDKIAEPYRKKLIPGYDNIKKVALEAGALGFSISGSGPSVFAIATNLDQANSIGNVILNGFKQFANVNARVYISRINPDGAKILEESE